jgi:hypothetical protein
MDGYYHKGFALFNLKQYAEAVSREDLSIGDSHHETTVLFF